MGKMTEEQYTIAKLALASGAKAKKLAETIGADYNDIARVESTVNYQQYIIDNTPIEDTLPQYWTSIGEKATKKEAK
jgi:uncharacterized lipoprotein YehR (DUF1307 family)